MQWLHHCSQAMAIYKTIGEKDHDWDQWLTWLKLCDRV